MELNLVEARVIGSLIEKAITTPDYYPMTLNSLKAACNQKSNRDPVMGLDDGAIQKALDALRQKNLIWSISTPGSRTSKYEHHLTDVIDLSEEEVAALCVLMLRGPQTAGEIRTRSNRLYDFGDPGAVETVLEELANREEPLVRCLPLQPGRREPRYVHLLCGEPELDETSYFSEPIQVASQDSELIDSLKGRILRLEDEVQQLRQEFERFRREFE